MNIKRLIGSGVLLAMSSVPLAAQSGTAQESKNQEMVTNWYHDVVVLGHVNEASKYMADDYYDHDPKILGGKAAFVQHYQDPAQRPAEAKQITAFAQGDYVVMVWQRADKDPKTSTPYQYTTYDVARVKNGKIVEHWDNGKKNSQWGKQ